MFDALIDRKDSLKYELSLPRFSFIRLRLRFRVDSGGTLPRYWGGLLRSVFGRELRRMVCPFPDESCDTCKERSECFYDYMFNTPAGDEGYHFRRYIRYQHPYVLEPSPPPADIRPGDPMDVGLLLFGRAEKHLPLVLQALIQGTRKGLGRSRVRLRPESVEDVHPGFDDVIQVFDGIGEIFTAPPRQGWISRFINSVDGVRELTVHVYTPLRLKAGGSVLRSPTLADITSAGLRRLAMLNDAHGDTPWDPAIPRWLNRLDMIESVSYDWTWEDWSRYSRRTGRRVLLGGVTGKMTLQGPAVPDLVPLFAALSVVHVGKGTVMGNGRLALEGFSLSSVYKTEEET